MNPASTRRNDVIAAAIIFVVSVGVIGGLALVTPYIETLELKSYDFMMAVLRGPLPPPDDLVIVAIDESSIKQFAPHFAWPWPRSVHAELVRQIAAGGAKAIAFDVVFDQPSAQDEDAELAAAIRESRAPVVMAATIDEVADSQFHMTQQVRPLPMFVQAGAK